MTRDQMIDRTTVTQPTRPSVPRASTELAFCHVHEILVPDSHFVPVRRMRVKEAAEGEEWDGAYEYFGGVEMVSCLPGLRAWEYGPLAYTGEAWSADGNPRMLFAVSGRWYCDHPMLAAVTSQQMALMSQNFPIVDSRPNARP